MSTSGTSTGGFSYPRDPDTEEERRLSALERQTADLSEDIRIIGGKFRDFNPDRTIQEELDGRFDTVTTRFVVVSKQLRNRTVVLGLLLLAVGGLGYRLYTDEAKMDTLQAQIQALNEVGAATIKGSNDRLTALEIRQGTTSVVPEKGNHDQRLELLEEKVAKLEPAPEPDGGTEEGAGGGQPAAEAPTEPEAPADPNAAPEDPEVPAEEVAE